ncbi:ABC transporter ATP-binding protein [Marinobacter xestospongiae]|uniref:ABC transporter ATP-binding protein n=1 Tax=Marinobacter xestospongiae TaxID=994319 RepID=A0ABU3W1K0_9GAMM|nr:ABC transporter ATP-binding protein [Marinobacter xestospongiae]MDV2080072.1 ABC transporter ATP-binding protein [Marinobacter xestospongiae]
MSCFELTQVHYRYDRQPVLRDLSLALAPGQILGLFGHNGAGKTTTIKLILGLLTPDQGRLSVLGGEAGDAAVARHIGYLPENVMFYPQLSGREILRYFARLKRVSETQVPELLAQVGLTDAADRRVRTYSKGMRQRLGLAQALLGSPRLLMLDEPTVGLDPVATAELYRLLQRLRDNGTGIVLCSHVLPGVEPYIDQAAILSAGQLQACGDLAQLRHQADMPVRLSLRSGRGDGLLSALNGHIPTLSTLQPGPDTLVVEVRAGDKMAAIEALLGAGGVDDLQVHQPTLEDLYCHFIQAPSSADAADHRGGA